MPPAQKQWVWRGAVIAAAILAVIISIVAVVLGGLAFSKVESFNSEHLIHSSGALPDSPYPLYLNQAALPLNMELPLDLSNRVGNIYRVWSLTAQPHRLTIAASGATWDGTNRIATFGGAIGDGIVFEVTAPNRIVVWTVNNVVFT
jgi:hypothetical protein